MSHIAKLSNEPLELMSEIDGWRVISGIWEGKMDQTSRPVKVWRYTPNLHGHAVDLDHDDIVLQGVLHSGEVKRPTHVRRTFYGVIPLGGERLKKQGEGES
ncbi:uncharacterized protein N7511_005410 [Penicillium nucicola]|uniref:uncharacterized protein n=1 Tax=Penicillium nucicola TaxID=1850975 RepID=UPI0025457ABF|nr:uncharacterized protein N7511_005410 [Penicillium nucicola]KAJ5762028.1 hypothetical protein N7511_005410 [Penicillium nucicola]